MRLILTRKLVLVAIAVLAGCNQSQNSPVEPWEKDPSLQPQIKWEWPADISEFEPPLGGTQAGLWIDIPDPNPEYPDPEEYFDPDYIPTVLPYGCAGDFLCCGYECVRKIKTNAQTGNTYLSTRCEAAEGTGCRHIFSTTEVNLFGCWSEYFEWTGSEWSHIGSYGGPNFDCP